MFGALAEAGAPAAVGHRIVHGGPELRTPVVIDTAVRAQLDAAVSFAPLHLPPALDADLRRAPTALQPLPAVPGVDQAPGTAPRRRPI